MGRALLDVAICTSFAHIFLLNFADNIYNIRNNPPLIPPILQYISPDLRNIPYIFANVNIRDTHRPIHNIYSPIVQMPPAIPPRLISNNAAYINIIRQKLNYLRADIAYFAKSYNYIAYVV